jgi:tetratricopeptide (TPR) repeat protein
VKFCYVLMPVGTKADESNRAIQFDSIFTEVIRPALEIAELEPIRAGDDYAGGIIPKPTLEQMMLCDYVVADVTTAGANVLYQLGVRYGLQPHSTVLIFAGRTRLPFDTAQFCGLPYSIDNSGAPAAQESDRQALAATLIACREAVQGSSLSELVSEWQKSEIARLKTDVFRDVVSYSQTYKDKLQSARAVGPAAVADIQRELNIKDADPAIVVDLMLSYRAVKDWQAMVDLIPEMSPVLAHTVLVREQLGFALNRLGRRDEAERILQEIIDEHGPNSETNGLLGRVQKDRWEDALKAGQNSVARVHLQNAIGTYLAGFESDWRDAYPGINAVTLMEMEDPVDPRQAELIPVVRYAVRRRLAGKQPDYWDHATLLELSVLAADHEASDQALRDALAAVREPWEPETTTRTLRLIQHAREARNIDAAWIAAIVSKLEGAGRNR